MYNIHAKRELTNVNAMHGEDKASKGVQRRVMQGCTWGERVERQRDTDREREKCTKDVPRVLQDTC